MIHAIRRLWRWYFRSVEVRERPENVVDPELAIRAGEAETALPRGDRSEAFYDPRRRALLAAYKRGDMEQVRQLSSQILRRQ